MLNKNDPILVFKTMDQIALDYICVALAKNSHSH